MRGCKRRIIVKSYGKSSYDGEVQFPPRGSDEEEESIEEVEP